MFLIYYRKIIGSFAVIFLILFLLSTCSRKPVIAERKKYEQSIIPKASAGISLLQTETVEDELLDVQVDNVNTSLPRLSLPQEYVPLRVIEINLDFDQLEEQIIAYKLRGDVANDTIRLLIANFNNSLETYTISWTGETQANNIRTLSITVEDLVGDHVDEIVCFGVNNTGEQTLDVFRRVAGSDNQGALYASILSLTANAGLEIEKSERSARYKNQQEFGQSFAIIRYRQNNEQKNVQSILKESYYWNSTVGRYMLGPVSTVSSTARTEKQMNRLYKAPADTIAQHLNGLWRSSDSTGQERLFYFDRTSNSIAIFREESQEWFIIRTMYKTALGSRPGLWLSTYNMLLSSFLRQIRITLMTMDSIRIIMEGMDYWNGEYTFLNDGLDLQTPFQNSSDHPPLTLEGLYTDQNGQELYFSSPNFTMHDGSTELSGLFHVFYIDRPILELRILYQSGLEKESRRYLIDYAIEKQENKIIQTLDLYPIRIGIDKVELIQGSIQNFEQTTIEN